ncbi:phospholipase A2 inhibitor and Ly6/PLAUR domain-containing protein-like [Alligator sinensis]|uniref:Phospholipase A2 inhibitor and Ly6/PLAUR domain-containing protein-like n=1 Tax=Alligator sinensis TaxID=38654 RepID=A0A3Q0HJY0_ALLSI|nr:phospholipase A2 inhibitor and Ly6/PLAUR domain-containing protein-like [Alligator sinensis]
MTPPPQLEGTQESWLPAPAALTSRPPSPTPRLHTWPSLAGSPLSCHRCNGTGLTCTGPLVPCAPLQDACFTLTSETHIGGTPGKVDTFKGCTARTLCPPRSSTLSAGAGMRLRGGSVCCSHDGCNRGAVKLPLAPGVLTGRWCPGCAVEGPACKPRERVPCRDHEDQCLYVAGAIHVGSYNYSYALRGCGTRNHPGNQHLLP